MSDQKPSIGRVVHYVSYGTPDGEYTSQCRAAIVADIHPLAGVSGDKIVDTVDLAVLNPSGLFFDHGTKQDEDEHAGGTWHWPERTS